mgnify:CR=1 FL=1
MPLPAPLDRAEAVVFDAYGTLLDVHSAVQRHAAAIGPQSQALSETWRQKQLEYSWVLALCGRYAPFWTLTERALDFALARHPDVDAGVRDALLEAYRSLDAYGEVPDTLDALRRAGLKTAILSNGDPAMLDAAVTAAGLSGRLDAVLSIPRAPSRPRRGPTTWRRGRSRSSASGSSSCPRTAGTSPGRRPTASPRSGSTGPASPTNTRTSHRSG